MLGEPGGSVVACRTPEREAGGFETYRRRVVSLSKTLYSPKVLVITQEAVAPSRHDWKIVDWDVKPQHKQTNNICFGEAVQMSTHNIWYFREICKIIFKLSSNTHLICFSDTHNIWN